MPKNDDSDDALNNSNCEVRTLKRRLSSRLFFYFLREFLVPFLGCLIGFLALFIISDVFDNLSDFLDAKASFSTTLKFFIYRQPPNLVHVIPMAILLASSFMITNLSRNHEITALRSAGISIIKCCMPVWIIALFLSLVTLFINEKIALEFYTRSENILAEVEGSNKKTLTDKHQVAYFHNQEARRYWAFENFHHNGVQEGVVLKQRRVDGSLLWELHAAKVAYKNEQWQFFQGKFLRYDQKGELPVGKVIFFDDKLTEHLAELSNLNEKPKQILNKLKPVSELEIKDMLSNMKNSVVPLEKRNIFYTEIFYRLSAPFACLIAALFGISLCLTEQRKEGVKGFALAVALVIAYYALMQFMVVAGRRGWLPPLIAGAAPTVAFIITGGYSMYRKR